MIEIRLYTNNAVRSITAEELLSIDHQSMTSEQMVWVDLASPTEEEERSIFRSWFPLHELVLEDMEHAVADSDGEILHHPKIEDYGSYLYIIFRSMTPPEAMPDNVLSYISMMKEAQLNVIVSEHVLITHHSGIVHAAPNTRLACDRNPLIMKRGPDYLLHLLMDDLVDDYMPLVQMIDDKIADLERSVFARSTNLTLMRLLSVKRELQRIRRVLSYQREIANRLSRGEFALVSHEESFYYRNVYDHLVRLTDQIDEARELATSIMEAYFSVSSVRLNEVMKVLTVISTTFLPITFITSLYGMNFEFMPELHQPWGYPAVLGLIVVVAVTMVFIFRKRGWLG